MRRLTRLVLAATAIAIVGASTTVHANGFDYDHLKCFKIRDSLTDRRTIYLADIYPTGAFQTQLDCRLRLPASHFCVNVAKENVEIIGQVDGEPFEPLPVDSDDGRDYLCYDLKCDRDRLEADALDQFGARRIRIRKSDFLCMPANKIVPTPPPTDTPTPTHTPTPTPTSTPELNFCQLIPNPDGEPFIGDICGGDCPDGETCAAAGQPGSRVEDCRCVPDAQLCSEQLGARTAICGGFCLAPNEICRPIDMAAAGVVGRPISNCECVEQF